MASESLIPPASPLGQAAGSKLVGPIHSDCPVLRADGKPFQVVTAGIAQPVDSIPLTRCSFFRPASTSEPMSRRTPDCFKH
jgi:hypothetical protein